jgi:PAS domain S-box-containing protein
MTGTAEELHLFVSALDITSQRVIEIKIREMEEQYRNILTYIRDVYFRFGRDGILISASPSIRDFVGLDPDEKITGRLLHQFFRYPEDARRMYDEMMRNGSILECESEFVRSDGTSYPVSISAWISLDKSGEISGEGIIRDITERRKIEQTLVEVNRKVTILGEVIRHDINNQLTLLQGFLSIMRNTPIGAMTADYILKAERALSTLTRQIEFIKIYQQTGQQSPEWQDLAGVIKNLPPGRIPVQINLEPVEILADVMFAHVFSNIFDNVERHGQYAHEIKVLGFGTPDVYTIIVADDGVGMTHDEREKIFERGYGRHTGLGLFLIREILGITGITIQETSRPGEGARFEIVVPQGKFRACKVNVQSPTVSVANNNSSNGLEP